jgi:hypothetical protein
MLKRASLFLLFLVTTILTSFSQNDSSCVVVEHFTSCTVNKNKCLVERSILLEIRDRSAEKYSEVEIPYSKKFKLTVTSARIEDLFGNVVRELKKSDFKDRNAFVNASLYEDHFIKSFELKHNVYPYRIRYQWRCDYSEFIDIVDWWPYLDYKVPTLKARLEIRVPVDYPIKIYRQKIEKPSVILQEEDSVYTFAISGIDLPDREINAIPIEKVGVKVCIVPEKFYWNQEGSHKNWKEFGNWIYSLNEGSNDLTEANRADVRKLVKGITDKREIITKLYQYLQEYTRYVNVTIGIGGLKPYPASYVLTNKYGDCKALAIYMKSMLEAVNIQSYYTVVNAGDENPGIIKELPDAQFNHAILCVPLGKDTIFLDCTRKNVPAGFMGTFTQGREAFVIAYDSSHFINIPSLTAQEVKEESRHDYELSIGNHCNVDITSKKRGDNFDYFNSVQEYLDHSDSENLLRERHFWFPSFELKDWNLNQPYKDSAFITLNARLELNNFLKSYGNELGFSIYPLNIGKYEKPADRKLPLYFEFPVNICDDYNYHLTSLLKVNFLPENQILASRFGRYLLNISCNGDIIHVHREFEIYKGEYNLGDYQEFYAFIQKVIKNNKLAIILTKP